MEPYINVLKSKIWYLILIHINLKRGKSALGNAFFIPIGNNNNSNLYTFIGPHWPATKYGTAY